MKERINPLYAWTTSLCPRRAKGSVRGKFAAFFPSWKVKDVYTLSTCLCLFQISLNYSLVCPGFWGSSHDDSNCQKRLTSYLINYNTNSHSEIVGLRHCIVIIGKPHMNHAKINSWTSFAKHFTDILIKKTFFQRKFTKTFYCEK